MFDIGALALLSYVVLTRPRSSWLPQTSVVGIAPVTVLIAVLTALI